MAQRDPDDRIVYLACQHIFRGSNSQIRKRKPVMTLLQQNKPALTDILREHSTERTCKVAKRLLEDQVFYSTLRAKIRFPELFDVSPAQSAEREASEAEAARDEAKAVREISERKTSQGVAIQSQARPANKESDEIDASGIETGVNNLIPSLYPVYIHYRSQHLITTSIQRLVEEACFAYAQNHFPQLLVRNGWDCPEAGELTEWTKLLPQYLGEMATINKRSELFLLLCELRHSAVHRLQKTAGGVERLAENAQRFLEVLNDSSRSEKVSLLRRELSMVIEELKRNKDFLERRYLGELKEIQARRAALDMWEQDAKNAMINSDSQCLDDTDKILARVVQYLGPYGPTREDGKGKMPIECPELSDSEEEFLESVVAINSSDCQALQVAKSSEGL
ncbi:uncharacterized protein P174DRAFT_72341 [Aspergillus novofumigatus IBT 16806]|uniref:Ubiquinol-cytochrome-c reductase cytochrome c1 n=1 Tax=Aspergillus novofumigatus (strain IBT 16806) TaxID=1392255 RepID=A0A2I1BT78_ASPN1|nr:uncharacterized protein P174DRAFT_72341 [Aspergillus novofumigatus IBT 16806]PKX88600.1 hypothetical protein P174DRAFT_72341 [Aspergillus novofumigatus IBT 16806]